MTIEKKIEAAFTTVRAFGGFTWGNARLRESLVPYARQRRPSDICGPIQHGHCDGCGQKLSAAAVMVTEKWGGAVPVCEPCAASWGEDSAGPRRQIECPGCGLMLSISTARVWQHIKACSSICYQRGRRKSQRFKQVICETCKTEFQSTRKDAQFCSGACRQWAYRLRRLTGK
jgi:hypothetical protein